MAPTLYQGAIGIRSKYLIKFKIILALKDVVTKSLFTSNIRILEGTVGTSEQEL
jgi:hypothetical protein